MSGSQLTAEEEAKAVLEIFDPKKTGYIELAELEGVLIANGFMAEKDVILKLFESLDLRNTGRVNAKDVAKIFQPTFVDIEHSINLKDSFGFFDTDDSGTINSDKLIVGAQKIGISLSDKQAESMIKPYDRNKDGAVTLAEYSKIIRQH